MSKLVSNKVIGLKILITTSGINKMISGLYL